MTESKVVKPAVKNGSGSVEATGSDNTGKTVISVKRALDQALKFYSAGKVDQAGRLVAQIVAARPRLAEAQNLHAAILSAQGKKAEAVKALQRAIRLAPKNAQYFANLGEIERRRGKLHEANAALRESLHLNPKNPQALNNLGILHYDREDYENAADCYRKALQINKAYPEAHNNLGNALKALGLRDEAVDSYQQAILLRENYPEAYNNMASVLRDQGHFKEAEHAYKRAISQRKEYVEPYVNLAGLLDVTDRSEEALRLLGEALKLDPRHRGALLQVARTQLRRTNYEQAEQAARLLLKVEPNSAEGHGLLAQVMHETDRLEEAVGECEIALKLNPLLMDINAIYGVCLKSLGRLEDAANQFDRTLAIIPSAYGIYANLSDLQKFTRDNQHFRAMEKIFAEAVDPESERYMALHFAMGKAYEDLGEYGKAFRHFQSGARLKRNKLNYNEAQTVEFFDSILSTFTEALMKNPPYRGKSTEVPIFIVGMPRSGSTLVEQVVANHPGTFGAGEIKEFARQLNVLRGRFPGLPKYPQIAQRMSEPQFDMLADGYIGKVLALSPGSLRITDKLLTNYYFVGLLHILFPKAKFIHTRRNPVDTCLSAFTKLFKDDMPHSYDLGELGRYYRKYDELMAHWDKVLPEGVMKTVVYEDVVNDLPAMARDIISFIGLPWDDACLSFHESARPVKTASVVQVRQPVYTSSMGRWKRYGDALQPLIEALDYHE